MLRSRRYEIAMYGSMMVDHDERILLVPVEHTP
jgi:hypothetical protein